jgi:small subunit ribosomal protein S21
MALYNKNKIISGTTVVVVDDNLEKAMRKFKKKVAENNILQDLRKKEFYEKPTIARKKAAGAARSRWLRKLQSEALPKKMY